MCAGGLREHSFLGVKVQTLTMESLNEPASKVASSAILTALRLSGWVYSTDNVDIFDKRMVNLKSLELPYSAKYSRTYFSDFMFKDYIKSCSNGSIQ